MNRLSFLALGLALLAAGAIAAPQQAEQEFSLANRLLFLQDHLTDSEGALRFQYTLTKSGAMPGEKGFSDVITMTARPAKGGGKDVIFDYLSGKRTRFMRDIPNARGNPIIMMFLQRDVNEMERLTGGHWRYFQDRVKLALEQGAEVEPITVTFAGKQVDARKITFDPYTEESREELAVYRNKRYTIILSEEVPGEVYAMRTVVPGEEGAENPQIAEELMLTEVTNLEEGAGSGNAKAQSDDTAATEAHSILVFPFDFVDTSLHYQLEHESRPADLARVERATAQARELIDAMPEFEVIAFAQGKPALHKLQDRYYYLYRCNGCEVDLARKLGADFVMMGWAQKVSNLILNVNAVIRDVSTGRDLAGASTDMRGNTDESWTRAMDTMITDILMQSYAATQEKLDRKNIDLDDKARG